MDPSRAYSGVVSKFFHVKLRKISEITATLSFTEIDFMQKYRESFAVSELGRIYAQLPLKGLEEKIRSHSPKRHPQGDCSPCSANRLGNVSISASIVLTDEPIKTLGCAQGNVPPAKYAGSEKGD